MKFARLPTQNRLREVLNYDSETGVFVWRLRRIRSDRAGMRAGNPTPLGYRVIGIDRRQYQEARLAWMYVTGEDPGERLVDHKNLDSLDNRFFNLRLATKAQNGQNSRNRLGKKGLPKGVWENNGTFCAMITINKKRAYLGNYRTPGEAHAAYCAAASAHFGEFARSA